MIKFVLAGIGLVSAYLLGKFIESCNHVWKSSGVQDAADNLAKEVDNLEKQVEEKAASYANRIVAKLSK